MFFAFLVPVITLLIANVMLQLNFSKINGIVAKRFSGSIVATGRNKCFGLDEPLFQRAGETIDIGNTFLVNSPVFLLVGFGNRAILINKLITPSGCWVYKTNKYYNIYVTPGEILFRYSIISIFFILSEFYSGFESTDHESHT